MTLHLNMESLGTRLYHAHNTCLKYKILVNIKPEICGMYCVNPVYSSSKIYYSLDTLATIYN